MWCVCESPCASGENSADEPQVVSRLGGEEKTLSVSANGDVAVANPASASKPLSANASFQKFCEQHEVEFESGLVELMEGCSSCVSANEKGEPLIWVSDTFVEMVGWQRAEVLGRPCKFLQGEGTTQESRAQVRFLLESKTEGFVSLVNYTKAGEEFVNALYICPLYSKGKCLFFLGSQLDIRGCLPQTFVSERQVSGFSRQVSRVSSQPSAPPSQDSDGHQKSLVQVRIGETTKLANQGPIVFDNEYAKGSLAVSTRTDPLDERTEHLFKGPVDSKRCVVVQLQIQFKQIPENAQWYMAGEIDGTIEMNFGQRLISKFVLSALKCWDKTMTYSLGSESSASFVSSSLPNWVDLDGPIVTDKIYNWESSSAFVDLEYWNVINAPKGGSIPLAPYWGKRPLRIVVYASQGKTGAWMRALEFEFAWRGHCDDMS